MSIPPKRTMSVLGIMLLLLTMLTPGALAAKKSVVTSSPLPHELLAAHIWIIILSLLLIILLVLRLREYAAARLSALERRFLGVFENAPQAIIITEPGTHRILEANPAATKLLGYSHAALLHLCYEESAHR